MSIDYAMGMGILLPFIFLGVIGLVYSEEISRNSMFFFVILIPFLLMLCDALYVKTYVTPFFAIIMAFGLNHSMSLKKVTNGFKIFFILCLLLSSSALPYFVVVRETSPNLRDIGVDNYYKSHDTGIYVRHQTDGGILIYGESRIITTYSGVITWTDGSLDLVVNGIVDDSYLNNYTFVKENLVVSDIMEEEGSLWVTEDWVAGELGYYPGRHKILLETQEVDELYGQKLLSIFDTKYVITYSDPWVPEIVFLDSVIGFRYKTYSDDLNTMYLL